MSGESGTPKPRRILPGGGLEEIDPEAEARAAEERAAREAEHTERVKARVAEIEAEREREAANEPGAVGAQILMALADIGAILTEQVELMRKTAEHQAMFLETLEALRNRIDPPAVP